MQSSMDPERWRRVDALFEAALDREPHQRAAFLDEACSDAAMRQQWISCRQFKSNTLSMNSSSRSVTGTRATRLPALFTSTSMRPNLAMAASISFCGAPSSVRSSSLHRRHRTSWPSETASRFGAPSVHADST